MTAPPEVGSLWRFRNGGESVVVVRADPLEVWWQFTHPSLTGTEHVWTGTRSWPLAFEREESLS